MPSQRYHALDALRGIMMLLGILVHASASYMVTPLGDAWPFKDSTRSILFDFMAFSIHAFRLPLFFVLAGFFASMMYQRRGLGGLIRNRAIRILLPLCAGWLLLYPLIKAGFVYAEAGGGAAGLRTLASFVAARGPYADANLAHLWFLYDLLIFYAIGLLVVSVLPRSAAQHRGVGSRLLASVLSSRWSPLILSILTTLTLLPTRSGAFTSSSSFIPDPVSLVAYGFFFGFGWLLFHQEGMNRAISTDAWSRTLLGIALLPLGAMAEGRTEGRGDLFHLLASCCSALTVWLLVFGLMGLFQRYLDRPIPSLRYVTDASYWMYLVHMPIVIWLAALMSRLPIHAFVKVGGILAVTIVILTISYDSLVRPTWLGALLNGRRRPRGLPRLEESEAAAAAPAGGAMVAR